MTFDEYAKKHLSALTPEGRQLVQMGWNGHRSFGDEPLVRYCPSCNRIGEAPEGKQCCPDNIRSAYVPERLARVVSEDKARLLKSLSEADDEIERLRGEGCGVGIHARKL